MYSSMPFTLRTCRARFCARSFFYPYLYILRARLRAPLAAAVPPALCRAARFLPAVLFLRSALPLQHLFFFMSAVLAAPATYRACRAARSFRSTTYIVRSCRRHSYESSNWKNM